MSFYMDIQSKLSPKRRVLLSLALSPFSASAELVDLDDLGHYKKTKAMAEALADGLIDRIVHGGIYGSPGVHSYRWFLTRDGFNEIADTLGRDRDSLLRELPVSSAWQSSILHRVDTAQVAYRLRDLAMKASGKKCRWHWNRSDWRDGTLEIDEYRYLHVRRFGDGITKKATASRLGEMMESWKLGRVGAALFVVTTYTMMRFIERWMRDNASGVYAWTVREKDIFSENALQNIWHVPTTIGVKQNSMKQMIDPISMRTDKRTKDFIKLSSYARYIPPPAKGKIARPLRLSVEFAALSPPARRIFDIVSDWPLISQNEALGISGMSRRNWQGITRRLMNLNLVRGFDLKGVARAKRTHYALTEYGCKVIARRDRVLEKPFRELWSVKPSDGLKSIAWSTTLTGSSIQRLAKELRHTDNTYRVVALLAQGCRERSEVELVEVLPAHRSERWFKMHNHKYTRGVRPDASGAIRTKRGLIPFMLEYEERAITPSAMKGVIRKYVNYFESPASIEDWGCFPVVLIVFSDVTAAARFTRYTAATMPLPRMFRGTKLPLYVSSIQAMERTGVLGHIWFQPHGLEQGTIPLSEVGIVG